MITVGSIVSLHGRKYKVDQVQFRGDRVVPLAVRMIGSNGIVDSYQHKDISEAWFEHKWELVGPPTPVDPRAKIIAKIKYLDEKFKKAQEKKAALKQSEAVVTPEWTSRINLTTGPAAMIRTNGSTSSPTTYNEFMEYYNSMLAERIRTTPF